MDLTRTLNLRQDLKIRYNRYTTILSTILLKLPWGKASVVVRNFLISRECDSASSKVGFCDLKIRGGPTKNVQIASTWVTEQACLRYPTENYIFFLCHRDISLSLPSSGILKSAGKTVGRNNGHHSVDVSYLSGCVLQIRVSFGIRFADTIRFGFFLPMCS